MSELQEMWDRGDWKVGHCVNRDSCGPWYEELMGYRFEHVACFGTQCADYCCTKTIQDNEKNPILTKRKE